MDDNGLVSILLDKEEIATVQEAVEKWISSATTEASFAGLVMSAMMSRDVDGESESGKHLREEFDEAGKMQEAERKRRGYAILAKLA